MDRHREAQALVGAKVEELNQLDDEALGRLVEEPLKEVITGPSGTDYDVVATGYSGRGIPEDEPDIYVLVEATGAQGQPPFMMVEGEIARFRKPEAKMHNSAVSREIELPDESGVGDLIFWAVIPVPWGAGVFFLVTRFV